MLENMLVVLIDGTVLLVSVALAVGIGVLSLVGMHQFFTTPTLQKPVREPQAIAFSRAPRADGLRQ